MNGEDTLLHNDTVLHNATGLHEDKVLGEVVQLLVDVVGDDFLLDIEVSRDTTFSDDLALESIEFVALAEKLQQHYGDNVNFISFIADLDINDIMAMSVGRLVDYIEERTADSAHA